MAITASTLNVADCAGIWQSCIAARQPGVLHDALTAADLHRLPLWTNDYLKATVGLTSLYAPCRSSRDTCMASLDTAALMGMAAHA